MTRAEGRISVFYDGACPKCVKDRQTYEKLAGKNGAPVCWIDITGRERELKKLGIDPKKALTELHILFTLKNALLTFYNILNANQLL